MTAMSSGRRSLALALAPALISVAVLAAWTRLQYINLYGGHELSYLAWADEHYFGGLTSFYVSVADSLVAGRPYVTMQYPPGYPMFLATLKRVGVGDVNDVRRIQGLLDACVVVIMYALARALKLNRFWPCVQR